MGRGRTIFLALRTERRGFERGRPPEVHRGKPRISGTPNDLTTSRRFAGVDCSVSHIRQDSTRLNICVAKRKRRSTVVSHCQIIIKRKRQLAFIVWIDRSFKAPPVFIKNPHSGSTRGENKKKKGKIRSDRREAKRARGSFSRSPSE